VCVAVIRKNSVESAKRVCVTGKSARTRKREERVIEREDDALAPSEKDDGRLCLVTIDERAHAHVIARLVLSKSIRVAIAFRTSTTTDHTNMRAEKETEKWSGQFACKFVERERRATERRRTGR
jgi:hypothetical protein